MIGAQRRALDCETLVAVSPFSPLAKGRDEGFVTDGWGPEFQDAAVPVGTRSWERPDVGFSPATTRRFRRHLDALIARFRPDVVHSHHPHHVGRTAAAAAKSAGVPFVYELRCINGDYDLDAAGAYQRLRGRLRNAYEYRLAARATRTVTISDGLRERLADHGVPRERIDVVRNSVDTARFRPREATPESTTGDSGGRTVRIGYATTFEEMENLDGAVEAIATVAERTAGEGVRLELVLAGLGRDHDRISGLVRDRGLGDLVTLPGLVGYGEMPAFYRSLDLFLVSRKAAPVAVDTTPLKPLEALACGIPLLSTDLPALRELLADRPDVRFTSPEPKAMADALVAFVREPWAGGQGVPERSWDREVEKYRDIYAKAIAAHRGGRSRGGRSHG